MCRTVGTCFILKENRYLCATTKTCMTKEEDIKFKEFYLKNFHKVKNFAYVYLNNEFQSENIAQDIFVKIYEMHERIIFDDSLLPYLYTATKNKCLNELRRRKTFNAYSEDAEYKFRTDLSSEALRAQEGLKYDLTLIYKTYQETLNSLPQETKETFLLHRENGLKYQDIADITGVSIKTIEYRISFALKRLRLALGNIFVIILFFSLWFLNV